MDEQWYYINRQGDHVGPCDALELSRRFGDGSLTSASMVRLGPSPWTSLARARSAKNGAWSAVERSQGEEARQGVVSPPPKARLFWSYIDVAGHEQGPFDAERMIEWHRWGHFGDETLVRLWPHGWVALGTMTHLLPRSERGGQRPQETGWETI